MAGDPSLDFDGATATMLADPNWVPSHALMLASFVFLLLGMIGLSQSGLMQGRIATLTMGRRVRGEPWPSSRASSTWSPWSTPRP